MAHILWEYWGKSGKILFKSSKCAKYGIWSRYWY